VIHEGFVSLRSGSIFRVYLLGCIQVLFEFYSSSIQYVALYLVAHYLGRFVAVVFDPPESGLFKLVVQYLLLYWFLIYGSL